MNTTSAKNSVLVDLTNAKKVSMKQYKKLTGLHFTTAHTAKMKGLTSISGSPAANTICKARAKDKDSICAHCYAFSMEKQYTNLSKALARNSQILANPIINEYAPIITSKTGFCRFSSFDDLQNAQHSLNFISFANANPNIKFALFTKNYGYLVYIFEKLGIPKPKNLQIILSSPYLNKPLNADKFKFADKIFTVYELDYCQKNNIKITCGSKSCAACGRCYAGRGPIYINELIKADQRKKGAKAVQEL